MSAKPRRRAGGRDAGALILSYLVVVPVFMIAVMCVVQFALKYLASEAALAAARQGADAARLPGAPADAGTQAALAFARRDASGYLLNPQATLRGSTPTTIQVTVSGRVPTFVFGLAFHVTQVVQVPVEKFTAP